MRNLIAAMKKHGVTRIVNLSAWGVNNDAAVTSSLFFEYFFRPIFLPPHMGRQGARRGPADGQRARLCQRAARAAA